MVLCSRRRRARAGRALPLGVSVLGCVSLFGASAAGQGQGDEPVFDVTVRARAANREVFQHELGVEELRRGAGTRGDALLAVQNLPGVGRPPFGLGAFILRASDPEDTLVTLDQQPIALPFHFYGLATTLATDIIERVEVMPGNFSARFGRVGGGVVNVVPRRVRRTRPRVDVDVDVIDAGVFASTPVGRTGAVALGLRRSWIDAIAGAFGSDGGTSFTSFPRYWDWQLVGDFQLGPRDDLRVIGSGSDDALSLGFSQPDASDPTLRGSAANAVAYHGGQFRWRHRVSSGVENTMRPGVSWRSSTVTAGPDVHYRVTTRAVNLRDELSVTLAPWAKVFFGADLQAGVTEVDLLAPPLAVGGITDPVGATGLVRLNGQWSFVDPGGYVELEARGRLGHAILGLRVDGFSRFAAVTIDPRLSAEWRVTHGVSLRAGLGSYSAPPRGYTVLEGFGNPDLTTERWVHGTAGVALELFDGRVEITADGFVKIGMHTVAPSTGRVTRDGVEEAERFSNRGSARTFGGEWMVRLRPGRTPFFGWISYTLQRAVRRDDEGLGWYLSPWDQTHLFTLVAGALVGRGWELGLRVRWTSGLPEPRVIGAVFDSDHDVALTRVDTLDPGRLPDFFSLDLRVAKRVRVGPVRLQFVLDVLNATYHTNIESRIYAWDRRRSVPVTGLPILPSLGVRVEY